MRAVLIPFALIAATPAAAQPQSSSPAPPVSTPFPAIPPQLTDPATADRLANMMQSLAKAFLDLPVGQIEAAAQGRAPTPADKRLTVRDVARRDDPDFDRKMADRMARTRPMVEHGIKALGEALPAMMQSLRQAGEAVERAAANMPDPTYPKR